jgi:hypothetical protein
MIPVHIGIWRDDKNFYTWNSEKKEYEFKEKLPKDYISNFNAYANFVANNTSYYKKKRKKRN